MNVLCKIRVTRTFEKQLSKVPVNIRLKVMSWVYMVELLGLQEVSKTKGFHDEPLKGDRKDQRSIRLNKAYRLIYRIVDDSVLIELLEVNKHDY